MAFFALGQVLSTGGAAEQALESFGEARRRFQVLADRENRLAALMAAAAIDESGQCLRALGWLDEAAAAYRERIRIAEQLGDRRGAAVSKANLGNVHLLQRRFDEALRSHYEARKTFENLGEPGVVSGAWHQIGIVHQEAGRHDDAEEAYRKALAIRVREKDPREADTLNQLGSLSLRMGRSEDAAVFFRQAAHRFRRLSNRANEGRARSNLANTLLRLKNYDEARREIVTAIEAGAPYGHAAQLWKSWNILHRIEKAAGRTQAAAHARQKALDAFLEYRRAGREPRTGRPTLRSRSPGPQIRKRPRSEGLAGSASQPSRRAASIRGAR